MVKYNYKVFSTNKEIIMNETEKYIDDRSTEETSGFQKKSDDFVFFWQLGRDNEEFSNWYPAEFVIEGVKYSCTEQYMMAKKAILFEDMKIYRQIMKETDPARCKKLGRAVSNFDPDVWDECCREIVFNANMAKFTQNRDLIIKLMDTGDAVLAEASPFDRTWGIGLSADDERAVNRKKWKGQNLLGETLMKIREQLKESD